MAPQGAEQLLVVPGSRAQMAFQSHLGTDTTVTTKWSHVPRNRGEGARHRGSGEHCMVGTTLNTSDPNPKPITWAQGKSQAQRGQGSIWSTTAWQCDCETRHGLLGTLFSPIIPWDRSVPPPPRGTTGSRTYRSKTGSTTGTQRVWGTAGTSGSHFGQKTQNASASSKSCRP